MPQKSQKHLSLFINGKNQIEWNSISSMAGKIDDILLLHTKFKDGIRKAGFLEVVQACKVASFCSTSQHGVIPNFCFFTQVITKTSIGDPVWWAIDGISVCIKTYKYLGVQAKLAALHSSHEQKIVSPPPHHDLSTQ